MRKILYYLLRFYYKKYENKLNIININYLIDYKRVKISKNNLLTWNVLVDCIFHVHLHLIARFTYFGENFDFFKKRLGVVTYFSFFFFFFFSIREDKIRKKTPCDSFFEKDMSAKIESRFEDQVTHWECTVVSHNIPPISYTYDL